jgi:hypothetical protein
MKAGRIITKLLARWRWAARLLVVAMALSPAWRHQVGSAGHVAPFAGDAQVAVAAAPSALLPTLAEAAPAALEIDPLAVTNIEPDSASEAGSETGVTGDADVVPAEHREAGKNAEEAAAGPEREGAHAEDHRWMVGELRYVEVRRAWCLYYSCSEEKDEHGGSVTLLLREPPPRSASGDWVRVEGRLLHPASRRPCPLYRAEVVEYLTER